MERLYNYIHQIQQLYAGDNWLDESFIKKLKNENNDTAFVQPIPGVHSVAEIVWHVIYWRNTLIKNMEGDLGYRDRTVDELNFLSNKTLQEKGWDDLISQLEASQQKLIGLLDKQTDDFLDTFYRENDTYDYLVSGIIQHDSYHLGQIGLVQKMLLVQQSQP